MLLRELRGKGAGAARRYGPGSSFNVPVDLSDTPVVCQLNTSSDSPIPPPCVDVLVHKINAKHDSIDLRSET